MSYQAPTAPLEDPRVADLEDHLVEDLVAHGLRTFCDLVFTPSIEQGAS